MMLLILEKLILAFNRELRLFATFSSHQMNMGTHEVFLKASAPGEGLYPKVDYNDDDVLAIRRIR